MTPKEIRLLFLSEERKTAELIHGMLAQGRKHAFVFDWKTDVPSAISSVEKGVPDIALVDYDKPGGDVRGFFNAVREHAPHIPLLAITSTDGPMLAVELAKFGVQDYLINGSFNPELLVRSLRYARERKRSEQTLAREQALLNELLNSTPDRIYFKDRNSRFIRVNQALAEAYHFTSPREILGKSDFEIHSREHAENAFADEQSIMQTGLPIIAKEERETHLDGTITWASSTKLPLRNPRGEIIGTMGISRDITKEKQAELDLERERQLLAAILDAVPDNVFAKNRAGAYILSNPAHVRDLGADSEDQVIGKSAYDFFPANFAEKFTEQDRKIIESGNPMLNVEEFRPGDSPGGERWLLTSKIPFADKHADEVCLVGISRDISELKKTEGQLKDAIEELRATQLQLIEAEKMKTVGRLAAGVAHEVKNPLNIISMGLDFIADPQKASDAETTEVIQEMQGALRRASDVIHQLLDFSGPQDLSRQPADVNQVLRRAVDLLHHKLLSARVDTVLELSENLPKSPLDRRKIEQVFINLIFNAVNAMPSGGKLVIRSRLEKITQAGQNAAGPISECFQIGDDALVLEFEDEGEGIPSEHLGKIFDPFFTTGETGKSSGLGLMVVKNIIDLHRGVIRISNRTDGGVRVRIYLQTSSENES